MSVDAVQICSGLGAGNLGDELMCRAFWAALPGAWHLRVEHLGLYPRHAAAYPRTHDYVTVAIGDAPPPAAEARGLLVGTTPVSEALGLDWPLRFLAPRLSSFQAAGLPVDAVGVGVEPLRSAAAVEIFRRSYSGIRSWTVRSQRCRAALLALGVAEERVAVGADWAWLHPPPSEGARRRGAELWAALGVRVGEPLIVVNTVNEVSSSDRSKQELARALDEMRDHGLQVALFCNDIRPGEFFDRAAADEVRARMRRPAVVVPNDPYQPDEVLGLLCHATATLGERYHFVVESVLAAVPPLVVTRSPKVDSLLDDLELRPVGTTAALRAAAIAEACLSLLTDRREARRRLAERALVLRRRAERNLQFLAPRD